MRVPEADVAIRCATSCRQQTTLMWTPSDCLYGSCMVTELCLSLVGMQGPKK